MLKPVTVPMSLGYLVSCLIVVFVGEFALSRMQNVNDYEYTNCKRHLLVMLQAAGCAHFFICCVIERRAYEGGAIFFSWLAIQDQVPKSIES